MLSSILNSNKAITVNIQIISVFTKLRETLLNHKDILLKLEQLDKKIINLGYDVKMHDGEIETIFELIKEITEEKEQIKQLRKSREPIGFKAKSSTKK